MQIKQRPWYFRVLWLVLLGGLLWWAMRNAPLRDIWNSLRSLELWQIVILLGLNGIIFGLITARWWIIVRADSRQVPFWPLVGFRLSVFGLSYFTPGPQVGGEPLQVIYLRRHYGVTSVRAVSAVIMDKLLEFLANFLFLAVGLYAIFRVGLFQGNGSRPGLSLIVAALLLWPLVHVILLYHRRHPVSAILRAAFPGQKWAHLIVISEYMAGRFARRRLGALLMALAVSLLSWAGMVAEYALMLRFLQVSLDGWPTLAALTAARLAFLMPLPAGLGALEASQVFALETLGATAAAGFGLSLLMRGRDILIGGLGLLLAGRNIHVQ